jgi:hypothetical protein
MADTLVQAAGNSFMDSWHIVAIAICIICAMLRCAGSLCPMSHTAIIACSYSRAARSNSGRFSTRVSTGVLNGISPRFCPRQAPLSKLLKCHPDQSERPRGAFWRSLWHALWRLEMLAGSLSKPTMNPPCTSNP